MIFQATMEIPVEVEAESIAEAMSMVEHAARSLRAEMGAFRHIAPRAMIPSYKVTVSNPEKAA